MVTCKLIELQTEFQTEMVLLCIYTSADPTTDKQIQLCSMVYIQIQCHLP